MHDGQIATARPRQSLHTRVVAFCLGAALLAGAGACGGEGNGHSVPGHLCPSTSLSPGLVRGSVAGPVFFISGPEDCQAHAYTYSGQRTDRRLIFPSCVEACSSPVIAPDGSAAAWQVAPNEVAGRTWAPDSRRICGFLNGYVRPIRVGWYDLRTPRNVHVTTFPGLFDRYPAATYSLLSCDIEAATAVLAAGDTDTGVVALALVSLTRPKVLWHREFPSAAPGPVSVVVAPDVRYLAVQHTRRPPFPTAEPTPASCPPGARVCEVPLPGQPPPPVSTEADLYALRPAPHIIGRIGGQGVVGWSGDGSRLITWSSHGPSGIGDVVRVLRATDGQIIWQTAASYTSAVSAPGLSAIAIQTYDPTHKETIHLIDAIGHTTQLNVTGQLIPSR
jgi:hypothetical protein